MTACCKTLSLARSKARASITVLSAANAAYRALKLLQKRGELDGDFAVPVEIRVSLSKDDSLRIAIVENLQRQNLTPLEEAAALTKLIQKGATLDDVAARTGLSQTTIKRRLALNGLCEAARAALAEGTFFRHDRRRTEI
jgi:ParB family chromosome partitioning protein